MFAGNGFFVIFTLLFCQNKFMLAIIGVFDRTSVMIGNHTVITVCILKIGIIVFSIIGCTVPVCLISICIGRFIFGIGN
ncbi:hypothetical protein D3C75_785860 [compost metagenome]